MRYVVFSLNMITKEKIHMTALSALDVTFQQPCNNSLIEGECQAYVDRDAKIVFCSDLRSPKQVNNSGCIDRIFEGTGFDFHSDEPDSFSGLSREKKAGKSGNIRSSSLYMMKENISRQSLYEALCLMPEYFADWAHKNVRWVEEGSTLSITHKGFPGQFIPTMEIKGKIVDAQQDSHIIIHEEYPEKYDDQNHFQIYKIVEKEGRLGLLYSGVLQNKKPEDVKGPSIIPSIVYGIDKKIRINPMMRKVESMAENIEKQKNTVI